MSNETLTIDETFDEARTAVANARLACERLRKALRYRTLTTKDADKIRRLSLTLGSGEQLLGQLREIAADRERREGTLA